MGDEDFRYLNRMVVERFNLLSQAKSTAQLAQFAGGACFFVTRLGGDPTGFNSAVEQEDGQHAHRHR